MNAFQKEVARNNFRQELIAIATLTVLCLVVLIASLVVYAETTERFPQFLISAGMGAIGVIIGLLKFMSRQRLGTS
jgi:protein-S-isoprenylcysteine O-methyltransferase Ste14